jgi:hypothetical protein
MPDGSLRLAAPVHFDREISGLRGMGANTKVSDAMSARVALTAHMPESCRLAPYGILLLAFAFIALITAELVLVTTIPGTNYDGADGKAAVAEILATLDFARPFEITNLNPLQGLWPQMMPMNVWVNPAYWPFVFFDKELATEVSGIIALICYATACYLMARCFDLPRLPSVVAAQLSVMLFGPAAKALTFPVVFVSIPGLAVVYAPHLLALGLLARLSPHRPQVFAIAGGILALLFYSLYCDPLWTMVSGVAWIVPFGVVTFGPLRRDTIVVRCAVLGGCVAVLLLSGALEYEYSLSQYTARVQFPDLLKRPRTLETASVIFVSKYAEYFYWACAPGWALGIWLLRCRPRILVLAAAVSALAVLTYSTAYLQLEGSWWLPVPIYIEHALLALFWTGAIAGYWGGLKALAASVHATDRAGAGVWLRRARPPSFLRGQTAVATAIMAVGVASIVPSVPIVKTLRYPKELVNYWQEGWPDEPELRQFLENNIGYRLDPRFRGSVFFYTFGYDEFMTLDTLWVHGVPTANEYSQLVTPQAIYFVRELIKRNLVYDLNWFRPWINTGGASFSMLFRTFRALGVRYLGGYEPLHMPGVESFQSFPRRQPGNPSGRWVIHEIQDVNLGDYSPTEVAIVRSAAEMITALAASNFDFTRQAVLSTEIHDHLVPARDMKLSVIRGGLHVSGRSDGTSLVVLPLQYSNCLRTHDDRARLVRANLIMTGIIFSGAIDTDISFDYGIFSPACRGGDFADMKQLGIKLAGP